MPVYEATFNTIFIIESLETSETPTGANLSLDLESRQIWHTNIFDLSFTKAATKVEFIEILKLIKHQVDEKKILPYIHLEMHGETNKRGLITATDDLISWSELAQLLREINVLSKNNLIISLAGSSTTLIMAAMAAMLLSVMAGLR